MLPNGHRRREKCLKNTWDNNPFKQELGPYVQDWPNVIILDTMHSIYSGTSYYFRIYLRIFCLTIYHLKSLYLWGEGQFFLQISGIVRRVLSLVFRGRYNNNNLPLLKQFDNATISRLEEKLSLIRKQLRDFLIQYYFISYKVGTIL